ncbi:DEKNAAC101818 [Brettanomyces naardenensis]|uniref:DEKNAAC101818 n=1 Tax=Brettanomyces naardenensis TaxID=13370 RepID=A0A448YJD2_BRENA|nr:DEKNAAC101818 [Brettanomyces naardenensis]
MDDESSSCLSFEGKLLNSNKDLRLDEALQRISMLKSMSHLSSSAVAALSVDVSSEPNGKKLVPSKEKMECLCATRQPNLPPKDRFESVRHQKDYESLVESQIREERRRMEQYHERQDRLKKREDTDYRLWRTVCQKYESLVCLPTTRELWWRGIPAKGGLRGNIWKRQLVGKKKLQVDLIDCLSISHGLIDKACDYKTMRSELARKKFEKDSADQMGSIKNVELYSKKIQKCFPNLLVFQLGTTFEAVLAIALAFDVVKEKEDGFSGIPTDRLLHLICVLYKNLESEELALHALIDIVLKKLPHTLLSKGDVPRSLEEELKEEKKESNSVYLKDIKDQFDRFLLNTSPNVYNHFVQRNVNTLVLIQSAASNLFSNLLNLEVLERILDIYIFEGDTFLLRCLLALIKKVSYKLFGSPEDIYSVLGDESLDVLNKNISRKGVLSGYVYLDVGDSDEFIRDVRMILRRH